MQVRKEFAVLFAVLFLPGMLTQAAPVDGASFARLSYHLLLLAVAVPQMLLVVYVCETRLPGSAERFGWRRLQATDGWTALLSYGAVMAGALVLSAAVAGVSRLVPSIEPALTPRVTWRFDSPALIPVALLSSLAIGYREEVFFRAYLYDRAEEIGVTPVVSVLCGSVLFALGHIYQGVIGFLVALLLGLILSAVYLRTRSLHGVAIAHGVYNLTILLVSGIAPVAVTHS